MLRVLVTSAPVVSVGKLGWSTQTVGVFLMASPGVESPFAIPVPVFIGPNDKPFPPGEYILDACSLQPKADSYGKLSIAVGKWHLTPLGAKGK